MGKRAAVCLLVILLTLSGCWDRTEIEDAAYIVSMGIDAAGDEYLWTFRIVQAELLTIGMLTEPPVQPTRLASNLVTVRGRSLQQAIQLVQAGIARIVSLDHLRSMVIGEELARQGVGPILSQLMRHNQIRLGPTVLVAKGSALEIFVSNRGTGELNPAKFIEGLLLVQKRLHLSPPARLLQFYNRLQSPGSDAIMSVVAVNPLAAQPPGIPLPPMGNRSLQAGEFPRAGGNPVEIAGTAVFKRDKLAGFLNVDETGALLSLRGEMGKVYASVPDPREPGQTISLRFHQENKPQFRAAFADDRPVVTIRLQLEGELLTSPGRTDYTEPVNRRALERFIADYSVRQTYHPLVHKVYRQWGADPVGLGNLFRMRFPTFNDWLDYQWPDHVRDLTVTVEVELFIRRFGMLLGEAPGGR